MRRISLRRLKPDQRVMHSNSWPESRATTSTGTNALRVNTREIAVDGTRLRPNPYAQPERQRQVTLAARRFWFIMHHAAKAPCRSRPVSSTLGPAMPTFGGTSLLQTRTPSIDDARDKRVPGLELAGSSSTNPKVKSAALRGSLQMSPVRLEGFPTRLSSHLLRYLGTPLGSQFHGRAAHEPAISLRQSRTGGAGEEAPRLFATNSEAGSAVSAALRLIYRTVCRLCTAVPNLSLNRSANGVPPCPRGCACLSSASRARRHAAVARLALR
jgi:hypothetical protein